MKRRLFAFLLAALLCSAISGCSSPAGSSSQQTASQESTSSEQGENSEGSTITISYWGSTLEDDAMQKMCSAYKEQTGTTVERLYIPNADYTTKMSALIASGDTPDLAYVFPVDVYKWADQGLFVEIYELLEQDPDYSYEDFIPHTFLEYEPGKCCGRMMSCESILMYYNKDLFDAAGVEYLPSKWEDAISWEEFLSRCQQLTLDANGNNAASADFDPQNIVQYGFNVVKDYDGWGAWIVNNGGSYFNEDGTAFTMSDPKCLDALQFLGDLCNVHHVMPDATTAATQNNNGAAQSLMTGAVAIYQDGQWACLDFDGMDFNWGVAVMPVGPDADEGAPYTYFSSSPMCIFKSTEHLEETWDFYMWLCNPDEALELYSNGLWQPVLRSWYEDEELLAKWTQTDARPSGYMDAVVDMTVNHILPLEASYINNFDQMDAIIESSLEPLWLGTASAEQAVANIDVSAYLDGSRTAIGPQS